MWGWFSNAFECYRGMWLVLLLLILVRNLLQLLLLVLLMLLQCSRRPGGRALLRQVPPWHEDVLAPSQRLQPQEVSPVLLLLCSVYFAYNRPCRSTGHNSYLQINNQSNFFIHCPKGSHPKKKNLLTFGFFPNDLDPPPPPLYFWKTVRNFLKTFQLKTELVLLLLRHVCGESWTSRFLLDL